jgi:hypothetical protein
LIGRGHEAARIAKDLDAPGNGLQQFRRTDKTIAIGVEQIPRARIERDAARGHA